LWQNLVSGQSVSTLQEVSHAVSDALQSSAVVVVFFVVVLVLVVDVVVVEVPQTFAVPPPPQVSGAVQVPQFTIPPQPLGTVPQSSPAGHVVAAVQQMPNGFDPGGAPLMHNPPQHD
jgi:hypothetical protein